MANQKISALTAATTPLAGTEVLPIVQGGATKQVSVANLTAGRAVGASTVQASTGFGVGVTPTIPIQIQQNGASTGLGSSANTKLLDSSGNKGFQIGYSDSAQKAVLISNTTSASSLFGFWTYEAGGSGWAERLEINGPGNVTFNTGNLIQGTAAKGVNFTANTPAAGMTSQLLNWYEEGTWTPNQGGGLTVVGAFSSAGTYTRIGRQVFIRGSVSGATSVAVAIAGAISTNLPYSSAADTTGAAINAANDASSVIRVSSATLTAATAIAATATITFSAVYSV